MKNEMTDVQKMFRRGVTQSLGIIIISLLLVIGVVEYFSGRDVIDAILGALIGCLVACVGWFVVFALPSRRG